MNINPSVYVASKTKYADMWKQLRSDGLDVVSSWIDEAGKGETPNHKESFLRFCKEIERDSNLFVLFCLDDDIPKGAYIELGLAYAYKIPVIVFCENLNQANINSLMISNYPLLIKLVDGLPSVDNINEIYIEWVMSEL